MCVPREIAGKIVLRLANNAAVWRALWDWLLAAEVDSSLHEESVGEAANEPEVADGDVNGN